jgi:ABC-type antimicrobial peptide transport system permease subunit
VLSARRRRREIAVLRALGFVRRQVVVSAATQAVTVAAIGIAIGLPLGVIVGRWTWLAAIDDLGMIDTPATPTLMLTAVAAIAIAGAAVVAAAPGWSAAQPLPAAGLREE